jgi:formylglycine-generating enzyme required for sulfatase activity
MTGLRRYTVVGYAAVCLVAAAPAGAGTLKCPPDSVKVGNVCIDTYEASVWSIPPSNTSLVKLVQSGKATLAKLTAGSATQLSPSQSCSPGSGYPANFPNTGNWTPVPGSNPPSAGVYAVSIPGVHPSACITWFQAAQACRLAGKRLLTNSEWQDAAAGTPDPGTDNGTTDCNIGGSDTVNTGSRSSCKSSWGVFDMVGNVEEWVADWADLATAPCTDSTTAFGFPGGDQICFGGDGSPQVPGALLRGGNHFNDGSAGVFSVRAGLNPSFSFFVIGFRCAR